MGTASENTRADGEDASFASLLDQVGKRHLHEVEGCNRRLAALQEENASLGRQLAALRRASAPEGAAACGPGALPGAVGAQQASGADSLGRTADVVPSPEVCLLGQAESPRADEVVDELRAAAGGSAADARQITPRSSAASSIGHISISPQAPVAFPIKAIWQQDFVKQGTRDAAKVSESISVAGMSKMVDSTPSDGEDDQNTDSAWFISTPTNPRRLAWDWTGAVLIFYDLIQLPLDAFRPPETSFRRFMDWFTLIFWTINMPASLTVGHSEDGLLVMDPRKIAMKYLRTWFVLDVLVVIPDWIFTIATDFSQDGDSSAERSVTLIRALRLVRLVRLLRLIKLRRLFETINDMINSEYVSIIVSVVKMMGILLVINHLICCTWYALADNMSKGEMTWVEAHGFESASWVYLYTTSFHWSITHFSPASMNVQPQNVWERTYALVVVTFALVGFSYIVGSITGSLAILRNMNAEESSLFWELRRYLVKNKVRQELSHRIVKYLDHMWQAKQESMPVKEVRLINLLSEQLHSELKYELAVHHLRIHPFFSELCEVSSVTVQRLANSALAHKLLSEGDTLFHPGEVATHMYVVVKGRYRYNRVDDLGLYYTEWVDKGEDWISEPALWTEKWIHCGKLTAVVHADNVTIDAGCFCDQVHKNPKAYVFVKSYAQKFLTWLNQKSPNELSDISQGEEVFELITSWIRRPSSSSAAANVNRRGSGWIRG